MDLDTIPNLLGDLRDQAPDALQQYFINFEDYWERKLWHELTESLLEYFDDTRSGPQRISLYEKFIRNFSAKINQLKLVTLGLRAATQCIDHESRLKFVQALAEKVNKPASQDAYVYATVEVAKIQLEMKKDGTKGNLDEATIKKLDEAARKKLDECENILETFDSVETVVHASFYGVNADYYNANAEFASYYRNALLYLACIEMSTLTAKEREIRAYDLSIAALVSEIYNFGELLLHPILDSLRGTPDAWLRDLLFAFNRGDLVAWDALAGNISKNDRLNKHKRFLYQKISLAALTEAVFRRPPHDRAMTFQTISEETKVQLNEIELLIMKALSLDLLRGTIDQVAEVARINWVQPKVLDMKQIENMRSRLRDWDSSVNQLGNWIEGVGKDVWAT